MAIAVDQNYDKAQRKISTANLEQFAGVDCQLLVEKETHRPVIMNGTTLGGAFKCASTAEVNAVKDTADSALTYLEQTLTPEQKQQVMANLADTWLPLSGGTVNGKVLFKNSSIFGYSDQSAGGLLEICGGKTWQSGAVLKLYTNDSPVLPGYFIIATGSNIQFFGNNDGRLFWNKHSINQYLNPAAKTRLATDGSVVTVPYDGLLFVKAQHSSTSFGYIEIFLDGDSLGSVDTSNFSVGHREFPVMKGQTIQIVPHDITMSDSLLIGYK